jgi:hypothetical protein
MGIEGDEERMEQKEECRHDEVGAGVPIHPRKLLRNKLLEKPNENGWSKRRS